MWERIVEVSVVVGLLWLWSAYYQRGFGRDFDASQAPQDPPEKPDDSVRDKLTHKQESR